MHQNVYTSDVSLLRVSATTHNLHGARRIVFFSVLIFVL